MPRTEVSIYNVSAVGVRVTSCIPESGVQEIPLEKLTSKTGMGEPLSLQFSERGHALQVVFSDGTVV